ncbi:MAG: ATP-binding cassette domain-containing protein, partial [Calditrichaceae bacterium]
ISSGESMAIVGPNGSGKTTLMRVLSNLIQPTKGTVTYKKNGKPIERENIFEHIGFVGPYLELYQDLTARENLEFFAKMRGVKNSSEKIAGLMKKLNLAGREDDAVKTYSSGMKQRLKYVFALLDDPEVLFVDEPRSNLDEQGINTIYEIMRDQKKDKILIIATNDPDDLEFADWTVQIHA